MLATLLKGSGIRFLSREALSCTLFTMKVIHSAFAVLMIVSSLSSSDVRLHGPLKIEGAVAFTEGPAVDPSSPGNVYFTDIVNNRIMRRDPAGDLHTFRVPSGKANGLAFDASGRLHACEGGGEGGNRRITRTEKDGSMTVLTDRYEGRRYNSPNDLTIDSSGRIFFTDPRYGDRSDIEQVDESGKPVEGVYRIDADGTVTRIINHEVDRPNGLAVSEDGTFLFVADNVNSGPNDGVGGNRKLWRFEIDDKGSVKEESRKLLFDWGTERGPDGLTIGPDGFLYVAAGFNHPSLPAETNEVHKAGVYCFDSDGSQKGFIPIPADMITNCTFGGASGKTLFITAGQTLWSQVIE